MVIAPNPAEATVRRAGRGRSRKRIVLVAAGGLVLIIAVVGYLLTSDIFEDEPAAGVLVTAVDIAPGAVVSSTDFTVADVTLGGLPHIPWSPEAPFLFEGLVALGPLPAGLPVVDSMFRTRQAAPLDDELEVVLELDLSATAGEVLEGDAVLLVDPGLAPGPEGEGRPPAVLSTLVLEHFDGSATRLFVPPEEWAYWVGLNEALGAAPQVLPVPLGGDPEDMATRLNEAWAATYALEVEALRAVAAALAAELVVPVAGPGELELSIEFDPSLSPTPPQQGDLVLLVDPGAPPTFEDPGRPRQVVEPLELTVLDGNVVRLFLPPPEWGRWNTLVEHLGAPPLVLPLHPDSDVASVAEALNSLWWGEHEEALATLAAQAAELAESAEDASLPRPGPGELAVDVVIDGTLGSQPLATGDLVLLVDPGLEPTPTDPGRPRRVLQPLELTNFDGFAQRLFVTPDEWLRWRSLPLELGGAPLALAVPEGSDVDEMTAALDAGWLDEYEADLAAVEIPPEGRFWVSLGVTPLNSAVQPRAGDVVFLVDPGRPAEVDEAGDITSLRIPPNAIEWRRLESWNGRSIDFWASPERYAYYTSLQDRLGERDLLALPLVAGELGDARIDALLDDLNAAFDRWGT